MKKTILSIAVLAIVGIATPKFIGSQAENTLRESVAQINEIPGYSAEIIELNSHWFSSESKIRFKLDFEELMPPGQEPQDNPFPLENWQFDIDVDLNYGPVLLSSDAFLGQVAWRVAVPGTGNWNNYSKHDDENVYLNVGHRSLFGNLDYIDRFPAFLIEDPENGLSIDFSGYDGQGTTENGEVVYDGTLPTFTITGPGVSFESQQVTVDWRGDFDYLATLQGIYSDSTTEISIESMRINEGQIASIDNFMLFGNTEVDEAQLIDGQFGYKIAAINTPFDNFSDIEIILSFENLSSQFLNTYQENANKLVGNNDPEAIKAVFAEPVAKALQYKPSIKIDNIGFSHAAGELSSQASIGLNTDEVSAQQVVSADFWKNALTMDSSLTLPVSLFQDLGKKYVSMQLMATPEARNMSQQQLEEVASNQASAMMQSFTQQGMLALDGEQLSISFSINDGKATLNNNPVPLDALFPAN